MVIVIIRYLHDYSNNSLKMDRQFLINFPMRHLGFTDIGSSFSLEHSRFCRVSQAVLSYSLQYLHSTFRHSSLKIAKSILHLFVNMTIFTYLDHLLITCTQWTSNWQTTHSSSMHFHNSFSPLQFLDINVPFHCYKCQKQTQHSCFTRVKLWSTYL